MLVEDIISYTSKKGLKKRLTNHWNFSEEAAIRLAVMELEEDHASLSLKAIRKILPHMQEGKKYSYNPDNATQGGAIQAAGYKVGPPERGESRYSFISALDS